MPGGESQGAKDVIVAQIKNLTSLSKPRKILNRYDTFKHIDLISYHGYVYFHIRTTSLRRINSTNSTPGLGPRIWPHHLPPPSCSLIWESKLRSTVLLLGSPIGPKTHHLHKCQALSRYGKSALSV